MWVRFAVESWILEKWCTADNSATFVRNLLAYRRPTPQRQPHSAHKPYGPSFTGFKTTSTNIQISDLLYRLLAKQWRTPKFRSFDKAEPNSQFRGKSIRNNLIRIRVSHFLSCFMKRPPRQLLDPTVTFLFSKAWRDESIVTKVWISAIWITC
jgi:hypothetical protein